MSASQQAVLLAFFLRWLAWFLTLMSCGSLIIWLYARYRRWLLLTILAGLAVASQIALA